MLLSARVLLFASLVASPGLQAQLPQPTATVSHTGVTMPLLSLDNLHFLEGTWGARSRDGRTILGSYTFARELNGHVLTRKSFADPACDRAAQPACTRQDVFYVYQDSPGAPLHAISFDSDGHVIHYIVDQSTEASTSTLGKREFVIFNSDPSQLGPRVRLRYEHNIDTQTGKDQLSGAFEMLLPDGSWHALQQWFGVRQ